ncbi:MAG: hypothetical protein M5U09_14695 [Gammaproteobacteria bacterium]|nr:hypothetical protein [Gammaproteobacteria bacterium]
MFVEAHYDAGDDTVAERIYRYVGDDADGVDLSGVQYDSGADWELQEVFHVGGENSDGKGLVLSASDDSSIKAHTLAASVAGSLGASGATAVSIGLSLAFNTIDNDVAACVMNVDGATIDHGAAISAVSDAAIEAVSTAASVAVAIGGGNTIAVSGGAAIAQNVIYSSTSAGIREQQRHRRHPRPGRGRGHRVGHRHRRRQHGLHRGESHCRLGFRCRGHRFLRGRVSRHFPGSQLHRLGSVRRRRRRLRLE